MGRNMLNTLTQFAITSLITSSSTQSLIEGTERYHKYDEGVAYRHQQVIDLYKYCKEHPNKVEPNDRDFILGALFASGFQFCSYNLGAGGSSHDKLKLVDDLLRDNDIDVDFAYPGIAACNIYVIEIGRVLKLLIPDFNYPQPPFHYSKEYGKSIHGIGYMPHDEIYSEEESKAIYERECEESEKMWAKLMDAAKESMDDSDDFITADMYSQ